MQNLEYDTVLPKEVAGAWVRDGVFFSTAIFLFFMWRWVFVCVLGVVHRTFCHHKKETKPWKHTHTQICANNGENWVRSAVCRPQHCTNASSLVLIVDFTIDRFRSLCLGLVGSAAIDEVGCPVLPSECWPWASVFRTPSHCSLQTGGQDLLHTVGSSRYRHHCPPYPSASAINLGKFNLPILQMKKQRLKPFSW